MGRIRTRNPNITVQGGGGGGPALVDAVTLKILTADAYAGSADAATFAMTLTQTDSYLGASEAVKLTFPTPPDFGDSYLGASDASLFTLRVWLSGSAGGTNPANANGANNGTVATLQTAPAGASTITMTSTLGANVPAGISVASAVYRGWFRSVNTLTTSSGTLTMHSTSALFSDVTMFTNAALSTTVDHLAGDFTFDLVAAGINTAAKLGSCQMIHTVTDAVAGVSPHVLTVDAGAIDLVGAF